MNDMSQDFEQSTEQGVAGVKKIRFDFEFTYPKNGDEDLGDTIVLRAPSFSDAEAHARMTSIVTKGLFSAMPILKEMRNTGSEQDDDYGDNNIQEVKGKSDQERSAMFIMALGLSDKKYIEFIRYVKKLLTNNSKYAHIDGEEIGISDAVWADIEKVGGTAAIDKILAEFTSFFMEALIGKETT